eukprot:Tbor_TRINITY_DN3502_c0_g1::TRINITY_DN3502_c0_g1_i1::g.2809::m.2809/K09651/RHBDD1; rhomboid domain-containing protein 1
MFSQRRYGQRHRGGGNYAVMLLVANIAKMGTDNIPPVTLGVTVLCIVLFLRVIPAFKSLNGNAVCFNFMDMARGGASVSSSTWDISNEGVYDTGGGSSLYLLLRILSPLTFLFPQINFSRVFSTISYLFTTAGGQRTLRNLALSPLFHATDFHLYYNMMSWLYKGRAYELYLGSSEVFFLWVMSAIIGCQVMYCIICTVLVAIGDPSHIFGSVIAGWMEPNACVVGFSGVIFALKTVLNWHRVDGGESEYVPAFAGLFRTPLKYAVWTELLFIQFITPHVTFLGHLAGILVGLLFIHTNFVELLKPIAEPLTAFRRDIRRPVR